MILRMCLNKADLDSILHWKCCKPWSFREFRPLPLDPTRALKRAPGLHAVNLARAARFDFELLRKRFIIYHFHYHTPLEKFLHTPMIHFHTFVICLGPRPCFVKEKANKKFLKSMITFRATVYFQISLGYLVPECLLMDCIVMKPVHLTARTKTRSQNRDQKWRLVVIFSFLPLAKTCQLSTMG